MAGPVFSSGFCVHCGRGLPFAEWAFWCTLCDLNFCNSCHGAHPPAHIPKLKYRWAVLTHFDTPVAQRGCTKCMKLSHTGVQCIACQRSSCTECTVEDRDIWADHEHNQLCWVLPPDEFSRLPMVKGECEACSQQGTILAHCTRCRQGITMEDPRALTCQTCERVYGDALTACVKCETVVRLEHDPSHRMVTYCVKLVPDSAEQEGPTFRCLECNKVLDPAVDRLTHPHSWIELSLKPMEKQGYLGQTYRMCERRPVKSSELLDEDACADRLCQGCYDPFLKEATTYQCTKCHFCFCESCLQKGPGRLHHHPLFIVNLRHPKPPDDHYIIETDQPEANWKRRCNQCQTDFEFLWYPHFQCESCKDYYICEACFDKTKESSGNGDEELKVVHGSCPNPATMLYVHPETSGEWFETQLRLLKEYTARRRPGRQGGVGASKASGLRSFLKGVNNGVKIVNAINTISSAL